jgi:hypothetical protein
VRRALLSLVALASAAIAAGAAGTATVPESGFPWPVQPFDQAHPVRSTFGDPRTRFRGPPVPETLSSGAGTFSFHRGVDIVAPDGTAVYPVRSGIAHLQGGRTVVVRSGTGEGAEYWHIVPAVHDGEHVVAYRTILGRIRPNYGHVHFTLIDRGHAVNPLASGGLWPYDDRTAPTVSGIEFRRPGTRAALLPELLRGRVEVTAQAADRPDPPGPGMWAAMATVPALVTWRVERARDGKVVVPERRAFDVRLHVPAARDFWRYYARGTRQNMATFKGHRYWREEGVFVFRLGVLDTRRLPGGIYRLVVRASDIRGNAGVARRTFLIWNAPGWPPLTPQA